MTRFVLVLIAVSPCLGTGCEPTSAQTAAPPHPPVSIAARPVSNSGITVLGKLPILGTIPGNEDVSGIGQLGDTVFLVSDETAHIELLKRTDTGLTPTSVVTLGEGELDLEAVAIDGTMVYAAGSHSRVRPKIKKKDDYATIRRKLVEIDRQPVRDVVARFPFDLATGQAGKVETISLRAAIEGSPELKPFADLAGKENGIDIEGLAVKGGKLFVGFRAPVLRANYLPVMVTSFANPDAAEIRFVNLGGLGIRDLTATADGLLILAGPPGDGPGNYQLFAWDGGDCLPGAKTPGRMQSLGEIPTRDDKPEGLTVLAEDATSYEIVVVSDGATNGAPTRYRVAR